MNTNSRILGAQEGSGNTSPISSPFHAADAAFRGASAINERVRALADRLCGSVPMATTTQEAKIGVDGVLNLLEDNARRAIGDIDEALVAISRIEAHLP